MPKNVRKGSRKKILGAPEGRKNHNCSPDAMEALPDPKTVIKISKIDEHVENLENGGLLGVLYISYCPGWAL